MVKVRPFLKAIVVAALVCLARPGAASAADPPWIDFVYIPAADDQPDGPTHDFRIGRYEIRNDEFVAFLNDALAHLDDERGRYLYFDVDTGDVYIHPEEDGTTGVDGSGTLVFDVSAGGRIEYAADRYAVSDPTYDLHPVVGVTWYGAVKFCNWLTLATGLSADDRVYAEAAASDLAGWRPVTISTTDWYLRDLTSTERVALVAKLGYRLPMDGGADGADPYNEWYKAASMRRVGGTALFDALYGFGRSDPPTPADANYLDSLDPYEPGPTPVGFYDGINLLSDGSSTIDTVNGYGLYDLSGNVWEWLQDQSPSDPDQRRNRGGSWLSSAAALRLAPGAGRSASSAVVSTGFRIVQSVLDDVLVTPVGVMSASGPWGGPYDEPGSDERSYRVSNLVGEPIDFGVAADAAWIEFDPASGTIPVGEFVVVDVRIAPICSDDITVADNEAILTFTNETGGTTAERQVRLIVSEPLSLTPSDNLESQMVFGRAPEPADLAYTLQSESDLAATWSASWTETSDERSGQPWILVNGAAEATGEIEPQGEAELVVAIDPGVAASLGAAVHTAEVTLVDECTGETFVRGVTLQITAPLSVTPEDESVSSGVFGGPFDPSEHVFTITNLLDEPATWTASFCSDPPDRATCPPPSEPIWLALDATDGAIPAGETTELTASFNTAANLLEHGSHSLTIRLEDQATGFTLDRLVTVEVSGLPVEPEEDITFAGPLGGPFSPSSHSYTVFSSGVPEMEWTAWVSFEPLPDPLGALEWLEVDPSEGIILDTDGSMDVTVTPTFEATAFPPGEYAATITFSANGAIATRGVTLDVGGEGFALDMVNVSPEDVQPGGPSHFYRIGQYEVTNEEYARFLNDAYRNMSTEQGQYLYHDTDSGDVYINDAVTGAEGSDAPFASLNTLIYEASTGRITFSQDQVDLDTVVDPYAVEEAYELHPVVGVSWFGAVKFCNWFTLVQGMPSSELAYTEGPGADYWRPVPFDPASPGSDKNGFRLPMDGGAAAADPASEWYKAASRGPDEDDLPVFGMAYGFGRDTVSGSDANYLHSGDPRDDGTTPVGFFDGVNLLADGETFTTDTHNGYGLCDVSGNVAEWTHDIDESTGSPRAAVRGGHFNTPLDFSDLRTDVRVSAPADAALTFVGFRVAQSLSPVELSVTQGDDAVRAEGPVGGPYSRDSFTLQLHNDGAYTLDDITIAVGASWLAADGVAPQQVPPGGTIGLPLRLTSSVDSLSVSPSPPGSLVLVPSSDLQPDGVDYDFWISMTEVTNDQFLTFLNDARACADDERGAHMYHDLDSGSVYINDAEDGEEGSAAPFGAVTTLLYDASIGRIRLENDRYVVESAYGRHPVVGVTWYGAVKYCNWLTIFAGLPVGTRAYTEDVDPAGWHPVTISTEDWALRNLTDAERADLVRRTVGYRLPMDGESASVGPHNEWRKAASARTDDAGVALFDAVFGFGRDTLSDADANFLDSGDTSGESSTEVGFFDGVHRLLDDTTFTNATDNRYGLVDLCGNVAEWTQDFLAPGDPAGRSTRGGSFLDPSGSESLSVSGRTGLPAEACNRFTGFRVARGTGHVATVSISDNISEVTRTLHILLDLREPLVVTPAVDFGIAETYCNALSGRSRDYTIANISESEMPWEVSVEPARNWVTLTGPVEDELSGTINGAPDGTIEITVATNDAADDLPSGDYEANVRFRNSRTGETSLRKLKLTISQPIRVEPDPTNPPATFDGVWEGPFETLPVVKYILSRTADAPAYCALDYEVRTSDNWLTIEPVPPTEALTGPLPTLPDLLTFEVSVNEAANDLDVGDYTGVVEFVYIDLSSTASPPPVEQTVELSVRDPILIEQQSEPWDICCELSGDNLPAQVYTLTNQHPVRSVSMIIEVDVDWIDLDRASLTLLPGESAELTASLNEGAIQPHGEYPATLSFEDLLTQHTQTRDVHLTITEELSITPVSDFEAAGRTNTPDGVPVIAPTVAVYRVSNVEDQGTGDIEWRASSSQSWVTIDGGSAAAGTLADGESVDLAIAIDPALVPELPPGTTEALVEALVIFDDLTNGETVTRSVLLTLVEPRFDVEETLVAGGSSQPGGPTYPFRMGRFHVTNAEFVAFLNDAMAHPDHPRGAYMFFDSTTGDVYVNSSVVGQVGADPGDLAIKMFAAGASQQIDFTGGAFAVVSSPIPYSLHPVTGVSWYGAVKYCNWITIDQGILPSERCYEEDTSAQASGWRPVTIAEVDWAVRDLNDSERDSLVREYRGYRLPMDDGYDNASPSADGADTYNEWFKAAAWNDLTRQNTAYGFGRNVMTGPDANYRCSGDGFELPGDCAVGGSTPTGYYDGGTKESAFVTRADENGFGLFDMTGNVHQWIQGRYAPSTTFDRRTLRGGSWDDPIAADSFRCAARPLFAPPQTTSNRIGFRVARTLVSPSGDTDGDGDTDLVDHGAMIDCLGGPGVTRSPGCTSFDFDSDADIDLRDAAGFQRVFSPAAP